jgi:long-chain acyl-CoA synthetase
MQEEKELTGYPSIDKPWLKYYSEEGVNAKIPEGTIYDYVREINANCLYETALTYLGRKFSYKELFSTIDRTAVAFQKMGVQKGDIVTLAIPNTPQNVFILYALSKLGAIANLIDLRSKGRTLLDYYREVHAKIVVVCDLFMDNTFEIIDETEIEKVIICSPYEYLKFPLRNVLMYKNRYRAALKSSIEVLTWNTFLQKGEGQWIPCKTEADDVVCILHTSGTTGTPKGVLSTNRNFNAMSVQFRHSCCGFQDGDTFLNQVPPFLAYNVMVALHCPLTYHMNVLLLPKYEPEKFAKNMLKLRPNNAVAGPADYGTFLDVKNIKTDLAFLHGLGCGSDAMNIKKKEAINQLFERQGSKGKILEGYGMTEVGSAACMNLPQCYVDGSVGIPLPYMSFCIYDDETDKELPYYEMGEICISGPTLMAGYYKNQKETDEVIKIHEDGERWIHSGDLGYMDENGNVYIKGRKKRIIILENGMKLYPYLIEQAVMELSEIHTCCAVKGVHKSGINAVACVFYTVEQECTESAEKIERRLLEKCKKELSDMYEPLLFLKMDTLPLTQNGKVDYRQLEKTAENYV